MTGSTPSPPRNNAPLLPSEPFFFQVVHVKPVVGAAAISRQRSAVSSRQFLDIVPVAGYDAGGDEYTAAERTEIRQLGMTITRKTVAGKLSAYLQHRLTLAELVDWAERAMMDGDFGARHGERIRDVVARLGLADVRAFGLTWEECEQFLERLGYSAHVEIVAAQTGRTPALVREKPEKYGRR